MVPRSVSSASPELLEAQTLRPIPDLPNQNSRHGTQQLVLKQAGQVILTHEQV